MSHDKTWHEARRLGIGGSDAAAVMEGKWLDLWLVKTGRAPDKDLSDNLAVQMGVTTEAFNRQWFIKQTGITVATNKCKGLVRPGFHFMRANLDGRTADAVFEAKHVGDKFKLDEIADRYRWQVQHYLAVAGLDRAFLSVFFGNSRWEYAEVARDEALISTLTAKEAEFWGYVERDEQAEDRPSLVPLDAKHEALQALREVDMNGSNLWGEEAENWKANRLPAKRFDAAARTLKDLVESDVRRAWGHGVQVKRASNGSLTIGEI